MLIIQIHSNSHFNISKNESCSVCALEDPKYDKVTSTKEIEFLSRMLRRSSSKSSYISLLSLTYAATLLTTRSYAKRVNWAGHDSQAEKGRHHG